MADPAGLELLEEVGGLGVSFYFYRLAEHGEPENAAHGYCGKFRSPLDIEAVRTQLGGGSYRVLARASTGQMVRKIHTRIAGPPASALATPPTDPPPSAAPAPAFAPVPDALATVLAEMLSELRALRSGPAAGGNSFEREIVLNLLAQRATPAAGVEQLANMLQKGIDLGRESTREGTDWGGIARDVLGAMSAGARAVPSVVAPPVSATAPPHGPAGAPPAAPAGVQAGPDPFDEVTSWVVRAFQRQAEPEDAAAALEAMLSEVEIALLERADDEQILADLSRRVRIAEPARATFLEYARAVLYALRNPPEDTTAPG